MFVILVTIMALVLIVSMRIESLGGLPYLKEAMPVHVYDMSYRPGLTAFLIGVFVINVPTFVSDMSVWQRIMGSSDKTIVRSGLTRSVLITAATWAAFAFIACAIIVSIPSTQNAGNPLLTLLLTISEAGGIVFSALFFVAVLGLYAASLSTVSTQLIAAAHAFQIDVFRRSENASGTGELLLSRFILVAGATISVLVVEALDRLGFTIADLVFAIFGAQLGMVPAVFLALFKPVQGLRKFRRASIVAVFGGFVVGWSCALFGKITGNGNLVFLSPAFSLLFSATVFFLARVTYREPS